jgi:hypothetical protein
MNIVSLLKEIFGSPFVKSLLTPALLSAVIAYLALHFSRRESSSRSRQQYNSELRKWIDEVLLTLSSATHLCDCTEAVSAEEIRGFRSSLSALLDSDRTFFPNVKSEFYGTDKSRAFRGFRPRILDWLYLSYKLCALIADTDSRSEARRHLSQMKREFTSDAQYLLDPFGRFGTLKELNKLLKSGPFMDGRMSHPRIAEALGFIKSAQERISAKATAGGT